MSKKNEGKKFEEDFKNSCEKYFTIKLNDSGGGWSQGEKTSFTPPNPCDFILHAPPYIIPLELKSVIGSGTISFSPVLYSEDKTTLISAPWIKNKNTTHLMIKHQQVTNLEKFHNKPLTISGFLFNFREKEMKTKIHPHEVFFVHIMDFINFAEKNEGKKSLKRQEAREIGIEIIGNKKRTRYKYDIEKFYKDIIKFKESKYPTDIKELQKVQKRIQFNYHDVDDFYNDENVKDFYKEE